MADYALGLDVASNTTGYAVLTLPDGKLKDCGLLRLKGNHSTIERLLALRGDIADLVMSLRQHHDRLQAIVIEQAGEHVHGRFEGKQIRGQAVYGQAVGVALAQCWYMTGPGDVWPVLPNDWTGGTTKLERQASIAAQFPAYRVVMDQDTGQDISDAIGLVLWWLAQRRLEQGVTA